MGYKFCDSCGPLVCLLPCAVPDGRREGCLSSIIDDWVGKLSRFRLLVRKCVG